ncbi:MAG: thiolase family protein [Thermoplasmata archaeon]
MSEAVIVSAVRTPQGKFGSALKGVSAVELGSTAIEGLFDKLGARPSISDIARQSRPSKFSEVEKCPVEEEYAEWDKSLPALNVDEVIMGNVLQGGQSQNPARQASIRAGIPKEVPSFTVNKVCASGMKAVTLAAEKIKNGDADAVVAGGFESMTEAPYILPNNRWGESMALSSESEIKDMMVLDGLYEIFYDYHMGMTAENLAEAYDISREEQERLSVESHNRAIRAIKKGLFEEEIVHVEVDGEMVREDEAPRETSLEAVKKLPPVFKEDGTVTAATSSGVSDGAAALFITSNEFAKENDLYIMGRIRDYASGGVDPQYMGLGPVPATKKVLAKTGIDKKDIDIIEENEAFASQVLACMEELDTPKYGIGMNEEGSEKVNPLGSGISLGHPIGCTGARIIVTMIHEMERKDLSKGLSTLCIGGGMGMATIVER